MIDKRSFHFKQFSMHHHRSTMKIGTDAVLLAVWISISNKESVLDIGTGSGIIPLILAQRGAKKIDAVEIDHDSAEEAQENFAASDWNNQLKVYNIDIKQFAKESTEKYDLVISNPPFFTSSFKTNEAKRNLARHTDTLNFEELICCAKQLMKNDGRFAVVLPLPESIRFLKIAEKEGFFIQKTMEIFPVEGKEANRVNIELSLQKPENQSIFKFTIRNANSSFTEQYNDFLKDFYIGL